MFLWYKVVPVYNCVGIMMQILGTNTKNKKTAHMKEKVYVEFIFFIWLNWSLNTQTTWSVIQSEPETGRHKKNRNTRWHTHTALMEERRLRAESVISAIDSWFTFAVKRKTCRNFVKHCTQLCYFLFTLLYTSTPLHYTSNIALLTPLHSFNSFSPRNFEDSD